MLTRDHVQFYKSTSIISPNAYNGFVDLGKISFTLQMGKPRHRQFKPLSRFPGMAGVNTGPSLGDVAPGTPCSVCSWGRLPLTPQGRRAKGPRGGASKEGVLKKVFGSH